LFAFAVEGTHVEKSVLVGFPTLDMGATGFDMIVLREEACGGLLATLNRGIVNLIGNKQLALAA